METGVRPFICVSVPRFSNLNRARGAYSALLTGGSTRRGQRTFSSEYYENGHTCLLCRCRSTTPHQERELGYWQLLTRRPSASCKTENK